MPAEGQSARPSSSSPAPASGPGASTPQLTLAAGACRRLESPAPASGPGALCPHGSLLLPVLRIEVGELLGTSPAGCLFSPGSFPGPSLMPPVWTGSDWSDGRTVGHSWAAGGLCASLAGSTPGTSQRLPAWPPPTSFLVHDHGLAVVLVGAVGSQSRCPSAWALAHDGAQPPCPAFRGRVMPGGSQGVIGSLFQDLAPGLCVRCFHSVPTLPSAREHVSAWPTTFVSSPTVNTQTGLVAPIVLGIGLPVWVPHGIG